MHPTIFLKKFHLIAAVLVFAGAWTKACGADDFQINWTNGPVSKVIEMYASLSGKETVIASSAATQLTRNVTLGDAAGPKEAILKLIREKVVEQTGLVISEVSDQVSITYNDRLPIKRVAAPSSKP